tara:strand:- start:15 stop:293 length:279 start_codon:yes stop_codon:yes gene_type:complete
MKLRKLKMPNNLLDEIRNTNLTTINDSSEVDQQRNQTNINDNPRQYLNNALVAKVLEDIIVVHCNKYDNDQAKELWNEVEQAIAQVRIHIVR